MTLNDGTGSTSCCCVSVEQLCIVQCTKCDETSNSTLYESAAAENKRLCAYCATWHTRSRMQSTLLQLQLQLQLQPA
jgi:hypothetical protein